MKMVRLSFKMDPRFMQIPYYIVPGMNQMLHFSLFFPYIVAR